MFKSIYIYLQSNLKQHNIMGLISKRKLLTTINSLSIDFKDDGNKSHYEYEILFRHGFLQGVYFSETELQNLAIEFAEWIETLGLELHTDGMWRDYTEELEDATTTELFTKFIEQRKIN